MSTTVKNFGGDVVEELFLRFNEELRVTGEERFELLDECPPEERQELQSLMNVAALARRALKSRKRVTEDCDSAELAG